MRLGRQIIHSGGPDPTQSRALARLLNPWYLQNAEKLLLYNNLMYQMVDSVCIGNTKSSQDRP